LRAKLGCNTPYTWYTLVNEGGRPCVSLRVSAAKLPGPQSLVAGAKQAG
jgi:hypothetical protein